MCLNSIRMASKSLVRSLPKKFEDALLASKPYCVAAEGAPVFEGIGGVVAYCDFYFDPKSMKANRFLACKMAGPAEWAIRSTCPKMETTFP